MRSPSVIAIIGPAGSGKTMIAKHLAVKHHYVRVRFAEVLKGMLRELGLSYEEVDGSLKDSPCSLLLGKTPRHAMQTLGTEWGRQLIHPSLWVHIWKGRVTQQLALGHRVVCDDCRYENEGLMVRSFQMAEVWRVKRNSEIDWPEDTKHSSEKGFNLIQVDRVFMNYARLEDLYNNVDEALRKRNAAVT